MLNALRAIVLPVFVTAALGCATTACMTGVAGNEGGSQPVNDGEGLEYSKAIVRCYKTGGTRVVKIMGALRCY